MRRGGSGSQKARFRHRFVKDVLRSKGNDQRDDHQRSHGGEYRGFTLLSYASTNTVLHTPVQPLSYSGTTINSLSLIVNVYGPLSFPTREGQKVMATVTNICPWIL
jgi:hypothetical protein